MISAILAFIMANYIKAMLFYTLGGALWAIIKWSAKVYKLRKLVLAIPAAEDNDSSSRRNYAALEVFGDSTYPPLVSQNKARLFGWALFWPVNLVWTMVADVAQEIWTFIYNKLGSALQKLTTAILPK